MIRYNGITISRETRTIMHRGRTLSCDMRETFNNRQRNIMFDVMAALILGGGLSKVQLFWLVYGNDPDGGPIDGPHIMDIHFQHWKDKFANLDLEMRTVKISGTTFYELVPIFKIVPMSQSSRQINRTRKNNLERRAAHV